jgi:hypothetical protein
VGHTDRQTDGKIDRQTGDLISLTFLFEESRLKIKHLKLLKNILKLSLAPQNPPEGTKVLADIQLVTPAVSGTQFCFKTIAAVTKLHTSRSQQNRTSLQHEQR